MLDLALLTELCQRVSFCTDVDPDPQSFHPVLSLLGFLFKAPLAPPGSPVVNALFRQRSCIENILRCAPALGVPIHGPDVRWLGCAQGLGTARQSPVLAPLSPDHPPGPAWGSRRRTTCFWRTRWNALASRELGPWPPPLRCFARKDLRRPHPMAVLVMPMGTHRLRHPRCPPPKAMALGVRAPPQLLPPLLPRTRPS